MPIHQSNVAIWNAAAGKADKVGIKLLSKDEQAAARRATTACASTSRPAQRSRRKQPWPRSTSAAAAGARAQARLHAIYREKIVPELMTKFGYTS